MSKIILIGSLTKDIITIESMQKTCVGGSVYYAAEAFNKFGDEVKLIPFLSRNNKNLLQEINKKIKVKPHFVSSTFLFENVYSSSNVFQRKQKVLGPLPIEQDIPLEEVKKIDFKKYDLIFLGPQANTDIPLDVINHISSKNKNICLHSQGFFRKFTDEEIKAKQWKKSNKYLSYSKTLIISESGLKELSETGNIKEDLEKLCKKGPEEVIINRGKKGFVVYLKKDKQLIERKYPNTDGFVNPNGITSTFAAVYLSQRLRKKSAEESADYAITAAYVKINNWLPLRKTETQIKEIMAIRKVFPRL